MPKLLQLIMEVGPRELGVGRDQRRTHELLIDAEQVAWAYYGPAEVRPDQPGDRVEYSDPGRLYLIGASAVTLVFKGPGCKSIYESYLRLLQSAIGTHRIEVRLRGDWIPTWDDELQPDLVGEGLPIVPHVTWWDRTLGNPDLDG